MDCIKAKTNKVFKGVQALLLVMVAVLGIGCFSTPKNVTTITDLSVVPTIGGTTTQLEGIWRNVNKTRQGEAVQDLIFFGNQYINAAKLNGYFMGVRGVIDLNNSTLNLYNVGMWEDLGNRFELRWEDIFKRKKDEFSLGLWKSLPIQGVPAKKITYTFTLENNQLTLNDGKNDIVYTKTDTQAVELMEVNQFHFADLHGLTLEENESVVIVIRESAAEANRSRNTRIRNDFEIRIDGQAVTTFGGGGENAVSVQADTLFGKDTQTAFVVPNGTHTLDVYFGKAGFGGNSEVKSNEIEFTANSSVIIIGAIYKGLMMAKLNVEKVEELVYDEKLDRMIVRNFNQK